MTTIIGPHFVLSVEGNPKTVSFTGPDAAEAYSRVRDRVRRQLAERTAKLLRVRADKGKLCVVVNTSSDWIPILWKAKGPDRKDIRYRVGTKASMSVREMKKETKGSATVLVVLQDKSTLDLIEAAERKNPALPGPILSLAGVAISIETARRFLDKVLTDEDLIAIAGDSSFDAYMIRGQKVSGIELWGATEDEAVDLLVPQSPQS